MYLALYRRFRPETFDAVLGQEHIVKILKNQINRGEIGHAYLFCGTRGTGKTTLARLLAKGVNCSSDGERPCGTCENCEAIREGVFLDVIEIDAASNNSVDNIRELQESVMFSPIFGGYKVYIIDEVHMLSAGAFNALLKTLEEPPERVVFILATTEPHKLPATIISRCLRLDFRRVPATAIKGGMANICEALGICAESDALALLASNAEGSVRDGLSLLDQCMSAGAGEITRDIVTELLGSPSVDQLIDLTTIVSQGDVSEALIMLEAMLGQGKEERQIIRDWIGHFRNLMLIRHVKRPEEILVLSLEVINELKRQSMEIPPEFIKECIFALSKTLNDIRWSTRPRVLLEVCLIQLASRFFRDGKEAETFEGKIKIPSSTDMREARSRRIYERSSSAEKADGEENSVQDVKNTAAESVRNVENAAIESMHDIDNTETVTDFSTRDTRNIESAAGSNTDDRGNAGPIAGSSIEGGGNVGSIADFSTDGGGNVGSIADSNTDGGGNAGPIAGSTTEGGGNVGSAKDVDIIDWKAIIKKLSGKSQILKRRIKNCRFSDVSDGKIVVEVLNDGFTMTAIKDNQDVINNAIRDQTGKDYRIEYRLIEADELASIDNAQKQAPAASNKGPKPSKTQPQSAADMPEQESTEPILTKSTEKESGSSDADEIAAQMEKMFHTKIEIE